MPSTDPMGRIDAMRGYEEMISDELGPVVLSCRKRPWIDLQFLRREHWVTAWILLPVRVAILFGSVAVLAFFVIGEVLGLLRGMLDDATIRTIIATIYAASLIFTYVIMIRNHENPGEMMVIHRDGVRYKRHAIRFDELRAIRSGRESEGLQAIALRVNRFLGKFLPNHRNLVRDLEWSNRESLSFVMKSGRVHTIPGEGIRCRPDDYERVIRILANLPNAKKRQTT